MQVWQVAIINGSLCDFRLTIFRYMAIKWVVNGMPSMMVWWYFEPQNELYDGKHAKRENGRWAVLFAVEYSSFIWAVQ